MTRSGFTGFASAIALGTVGMVAAVEAAELPETQLSVIGAISIQPSWQNVEVPFWHERLPEASGGHVAADITPWNEMGLRGPEVFHMLRRGVAQMGSIVLSYNSGDVRENDGIDVALLSPTLEEALAVREAYRPVLSRLYEERYGLKLLTLVPMPPQILYCRPEITSLDDLDGRSVRVSNATQGHFVQHYGGNDVSIAFGEMQTALQTGVVDCGLTSSAAGYATGWHDAADYIYPIPINWQFVGYFANLDEWNKLDPAVQEFLLEELAGLEEAVTAQSDYEHETGIACLTGMGECPDGDPGSMTLVEVRPEDEASRLEALEQTILPRWASACGAECVAKWNETVGAVVGVTATID